MSESKQVYIELNSKEELHELLKHNPGVIIIKLGATWCKPCMKIKDQVDELFLNTPANVLCFDLDVDKMFNVFAYLKKHRRINGIPAIIAWKKGNTSVIPDYSVTGSNIDRINTLFKNIIIV